MGYTERIIDVGPLRFNPLVSVIAFVVLWGFAIWCIEEPKEALSNLTLWRDWVAYYFTWLYIISQDAWILFAAFVYMKWGNKKLCAKGAENDKPEFSDSTYFMMLFTCGVAVGMFFYGVTEPTTYYTDGTTRYFANAGLTDSEKAQWAITLTVFHWGLHGWIPYCLVGLTLGFAAYRQGKPLNMRSTMYPLLGSRVNGWVGDCIDILSIIVVVAGVCTSLGLGTQQIAEGLYRLDQDLFDNTDEDEQKDAWVTIIVVITFIASLSVVSGIHYGIKTIAITAFMLANFVWLMVFCMDDPVYSLDIAVQTLGHYLQYFLELGFTTDAFQRQRQHGNPGDEYVDAINKPDYIYPGAPLDTYGLDGAGNPTGNGAEGGNPKFMQWWTIFYWGWWIAWSPFVGLFIARISKGRTVREVFNYSMTAPLLYIIMWFAVFGGAGIKMHNTATECRLQNEIGFGGAGNFAAEYARSVCCPTTTKFRTSGAWQILEAKGPYNATTYPNGIVSSKMCEGLHPQNWNETAYPTKASYVETLGLTADEAAFVNGADVSNDDARRTVYEFSYNGPANFFETLEQYYGWGEFLSGVTIVTIILYFVTSSDSGSLVVDLISAGGNRDKNGKEKDPHWFQRVVWSMTEGGLACGLMKAGGAEATKALQAMSIAVGLPFTIVLCFMMPSLYRMLQIDDEEADEADFEWKMPIFGGFLDIMDYIFSFGGRLGGSPTIDALKADFIEFVQGFLPFIHAQKVLAKLDVDGKKKYSNMAMVFGLFSLFVLWVMSMSLQAHSDHGGWFAFANCVYLGMALILTVIRAQVREDSKIKGNMVEDFLCSYVFYFNTGPQLWKQVQDPVAAPGPAAPKAEELELTTGVTTATEVEDTEPTKQVSGV